MHRDLLALMTHDILFLSILLRFWIENVRVFVLALGKCNINTVEHYF
jgi:hypothetical protein